MLPALFLIPLVALFRIWLAWQPTVGSSCLLGFSPVAAVALCAGLFLSRRLALIVPLGILFVSDLVINFHYHVPYFFGPTMLARYLLLATLVGGGLILRRRLWGRSFASVLGATLAGSVFFYVASNGFAWAGSAAYPQTFAGFWQALTVGLPGFPPSWVFFRNELVSDALYSMVFVACVRLTAPAREEAASSAPVVA